jgi:hypothetical protein
MHLPMILLTPTDHLTEDCIERLVVRECNTECIARGAKGTYLFAEMERAR